MFSFEKCATRFLAFLVTLGFANAKLQLKKMEAWAWPPPVTPLTVYGPGPNDPILINPTKTMNAYYENILQNVKNDRLYESDVGMKLKQVDDKWKELCRDTHTKFNTELKQVDGNYRKFRQIDNTEMNKRLEEHRSLLDTNMQRGFGDLRGELAKHVKELEQKIHQEITEVNDQLTRKGQEQKTQEAAVTKAQEDIDHVNSAVANLDTRVNDMGRRSSAQMNSSVDGMRDELRQAEERFTERSTNLENKLGQMEHLMELQMEKQNKEMIQRDEEMSAKFTNLEARHEEALKEKMKTQLEVQEKHHSELESQVAKAQALVRWHSYWLTTQMEEHEVRLDQQNNKTNREMAATLEFALQRHEKMLDAQCCQKQKALEEETQKQLEGQKEFRAQLEKVSESQISKFEESLKRTDEKVDRLERELKQYRSEVAQQAVGTFSRLWAKVWRKGANAPVATSVSESAASSGEPTDTRTRDSILSSAPHTKAYPNSLRYNYP